MKTTIYPIPNGWAVRNENGSFVGFAKDIETAEQIKAKADKAATIAASLERQGYSLGW
jgi:hypothetical protein